MKIVVAPDKFRGSLPATQVAAAIAAGLHAGRPGAEVVTIPMAERTFNLLKSLEGLSASINGATHYKMPVNTDTITLEKIPWVAPEEVEVEGPDERALIYRGGETIEWKVVTS